MAHRRIASELYCKRSCLRGFQAPAGSSRERFGGIRGTTVTVLRKRSKPNGLGPLFSYLRQEGGNTAAITAVLLVPIIGALSLGVETSSWFVAGRAAQNAADSAAVAAANNGVSTEYLSEGRANAARYGFTHASNNVTVNVQSGQACPDGSTACYKATVTKVMPIYLTRIVGFSGDTTIGAQPAKTVTSVAWAEPISGINYPSCLTSTGNGSSGKGIQTKGAPFSNMPGCSISATGPSSPVDCNGQGIGGNPSIFSTSSISSACTGGSTAANRPSSVFSDPYADDYKKIPCTINGETTNCASGSVSCGAFSGTLTAGACYSGNVNLSGANNINPTGPSVIYIKNGNLNLNTNATLTANNVTFVFTGSSVGGITGGKQGAVSITAPSSGAWSGVAAYQDTHQVSSTYTANPWTQNGGTPTVDITGLMYLPRTDVDFGGGAGAATKPTTCYIAIYHSYAVNGTGLNMTRTGCAAAGLTELPTVQILRAALVK